MAKGFLDLERFKGQKINIVSSAEVLKKAVPFPVNDALLKGQAQIVVTGVTLPKGEKVNV